jgi:hypothetical protein
MLKRRIFLILSLVLMAAGLSAQQSNTLFFMHGIPESNFINPAVQGRCGVFLGLPLVSSVHVHASNSGFTLNQLLKKQTAGGYAVDAQNALSHLGRSNLLTTEFYTTWLALGVQRNDWYFTFTIQEKDNLAASYSRDLVAFGLKGNTQFEGQWINMHGTGVWFNHMREYALGVSKVKSRSLTLGMKAKLLFGKLNLTTGRSQIGLFTAENTFDLMFDMNAGFRSSMPYSLTPQAGSTYRVNNYYDGSVSSYFFNRRNPGLAFDLGFIYRKTERLTLSGSLLDLGAVWYRSNRTDYHVEGQYRYQGPAMDSAISETFFWDVFDALNENLNFTLGRNSYVYLLDPRLYLGATYKINNRVDAHALLYNRLLPRKLQTSATVSLSAKFLKTGLASISWSYMNRSLANVGLGVAAGSQPLQFYLVSDNLLCFFMPMDTKNVNLRFGINLRFGCNNRQSDTFIEDCGCAWYQDADARDRRIENIRKNMKRP